MWTFKRGKKCEITFPSNRKCLSFEVFSHIWMEYEKQEESMHIRTRILQARIRNFWNEKIRSIYSVNWYGIRSRSHCENFDIWLPKVQYICLKEFKLWLLNYYPRCSYIFSCFPFKWVEKSQFDYRILLNHITIVTNGYGKFSLYIYIKKVANSFCLLQNFFPKAIRRKK